MVFNNTRPLLLLAPIAVLLAGCGGANTAARTSQITHIRAIVTLYFSAASSLGKAPENEAEFKSEIAQKNPTLKTLGVGSVDELFTSERDGKPLVILYGKPTNDVAAGVIAYEREGKDGVRQVGFNNGQVQDADAATFAKLVLKPVS